MMVVAVDSPKVLQFSTAPFSATRDARLPVNVRVESIQVVSLLCLSMRDALFTLSVGISVGPDSTDTLIGPVHTELVQEIATSSLLQV